MTTIREMLPGPAQNFAEVLIGAGLGALIGGYVVKRKASEGAIVGALAGYGLQLMRPKGAWPFATAGYYVGADDVLQLGPPSTAYSQPVEEVIPEMVPEWQRDWRRHGWHGWDRSGAGYGQRYGGFGGHGWRR